MRVMLAAAVVVGLAGCDWTMVGYDAGHSYFNPTEAALSPANVSGLTQRWVTPTGSTVVSAPTVAKGIVYVTTSDGQLRAFDASSGTPKWHVAAIGTPAIADGRLYAVGSNGILTAFDAATGARKWAATVGTVSSSPVVAGGFVYAGGAKQSLYAYDAATGALAWSVTASADPTTSDGTPAVAGGAVYVLTNFAFAGTTFRPSILRAYDATNGVLRWEKSTDAAAFTVSVVGGRAFVANFAGVLAYDAGTGARLWTGTTCINDLNWALEHVAVADGVVYTGAPAQCFFAFDAATGAERWHTFASQATSSPAAANGVLYTTARGGMESGLAAYDAATGTQLYFSAGPGSNRSDTSPIVANGSVYVGGDDGKIRAFSRPGHRSTEMVSTAAQVPRHFPGGQ